MYRKVCTYGKVRLHGTNRPRCTTFHSLGRVLNHPIGRIGPSRACAGQLIQTWTWTGHATSTLSHPGETLSDPDGTLTETSSGHAGPSIWTWTGHACPWTWTGTWNVASWTWNGSGCGGGHRRHSRGRVGRIWRTGRSAPARRTSGRPGRQWRPLRHACCNIGRNQSHDFHEFCDPLGCRRRRPCRTLRRGPRCRPRGSCTRSRRSLG